jgi:hypothetical protein
MNNKFEFVFHEYLFHVVFLPSSPMLHGPSAKNRPVELEHPGPPFSQIVVGAFSGLLRASKNLE